MSEATRPSFPLLDTGVRQAAAEEAVLAFWRDRRIFERSIEERAGAPAFVFYEGPPTTNGRPGVHHVMTRTVKDLVCRFRTMDGHQVLRKGGWDTHGLPVEIEVEKELGIEGKQGIEVYGVDKFNARCRESVFKYRDEWNRITERIGFWLDLADPYITLENDYIESVWHLLKRFWDRGLVYAGFKIVPYCPRCGTALSDHEVSQGYKEVKDPSVYVKFALEDEPSAFILAWTTTPWTLPGNVALAVGPDLAYVKVREGEDTYYLAKDRLSVLRGEHEILQELKGRDLVGRRYRPLFEGIDLRARTGKDAYYVAAADFVTTEDGTGVVHTAVMYGADDYALGETLDLPKHHTVDEAGRFTDDVPQWRGRRVREIDPEIVADLKARGLLYAKEPYLHNYPFCWRCDSALIYYARDSWYLRTTELRDLMLAENARVQWFPPEVGENRFGNWLKGNVDWAISRDRYWGTPLPLWECDSDRCGETVCIGSRAELRERGGRFEDDLDLHRPAVDHVTFPCAKCGGTMRRTREVVDVWFDSGAMPFAQWHYPFAGRERFAAQFPADFISEGIDQSRGWFYSLLAISAMEMGKAPFRTVVSLGLVLDADGRKMSKRLGNAVDPWEILSAEGADALRWYLVANSPPWAPTRFSRDGVTEAARKVFGTLRNTAAFLATYANVDGWTPGGDAPPVAARPLLDRWILSRLDDVTARVGEDLRGYQITRAARTLSAFVQDDLSNWYVRRNRRRFWKGEKGPDKDGAYATLHEALATLAKLLAPFAPFTAEELHRAMVTPFDPAAPESVHLARFPEPGNRRNEALERRMALVLAAVEAGRAARTESGLKVRQPVARLLLLRDPASTPLDEELLEIVRDELNVKEVAFASADAVMDFSLKPNFPALGPRFGGAVNRVAAAIKALESSAVAAGRAAASWTVSVEGMGEVTIGASEVTVEEHSRAGFSLAGDAEMKVALAVHLDESLRREGLVRELVHRIQNLRKERGLAVTDRVVLAVAADGPLAEALERHREFVESEVLAERFVLGGVPAGEAWDLDGSTVRVALEKA